MMVERVDSELDLELSNSRPPFLELEGVVAGTQEQRCSGVLLHQLPESMRLRLHEYCRSWACRRLH